MTVTTPETARDLANRYNDEKTEEAVKHAITAVEYYAKHGKFEMTIDNNSSEEHKYEPFDRFLICSCSHKVAAALEKLGYKAKVESNKVLPECAPYGPDGLGSYLYVSWSEE